jgi:surfeit locus 1 family protein
VSRTAIRRLLGPGLITLAMLTVLAGLGTWQVRRLHWKQTVLAQIAQAEADPPVPLPANPSPFMKVVVTGRLRADLSALYGAEVRETPAGPQMGAHLIVPLERDNAPPLLIDRGWVPLNRASPIEQPESAVSITGFIHPPESRSWFSVADDPAARQFFTLDPAAIRAALGLARVAPFTLVALGSSPAAQWPDPAHHLPRPPNNHLAYAITWYGLAGALLIIFALWARKELRA